jgi:formylglycine-generating enzyme required for sulfatase activity
VTSWRNAVVASALCACNSGEARPQLLIHVDTDAALTGHVLGDEEYSSEIAVDTLRVDLLGSGAAASTEVFLAPEAANWPLSFGVVTPEGREGEHVLVRLRLYRASLARLEETGGVVQPRPLPEASIDRVLDLELPAEGVVDRQVTLALSCWGVVPSFGDSPLTCVDGGRRDAAAATGVSSEPGDGTLAGSSPLARSEPCLGAPVNDSLCVDGGTFLLGDTRVVGLEDVFNADGVPVRAVHLKPFWLDRTEVTVGEVRPLAGLLTTPPPGLFDVDDEDYERCTWLGEDDPTHDALPLTCVEWSTAREVCQLRGGDLPTEAQWEYAASGRGQGRRYPWGDAQATCCTASLDRVFTCGGTGPDPVGAHTQGCEHVDVTRDDVLDMGGNVIEWTRDAFVPYGDGCWAGVGLIEEPFCDEDAQVRSTRGADWTAGLGAPLAAWRHSSPLPGSLTGFRCSYEDVVDASP